MLDKLKQVEDRYEELCARAEQPDFYADPKKAAAWLREQKELAPIVAAYRAYCAAQRDMQDAAELMTGQTDAELKALCQEELTGAKKRAAALEQELRVLLLPHDPNDGKNVILEIRPGVVTRSPLLSFPRKMTPALSAGPTTWGPRTISAVPLIWQCSGGVFPIP